MRKIFTFLFSVLFVTSLLAQEAYINQTFDPPTVGGDIDEQWDQADPEAISKIYIGADGLENPTLGEVGDSYWKGLWDYDGIYLLVYAADDTYAPFYDRVDQEDDGSPHTYDQVEVFLDVNAEKDDGGGGRYGGIGDGWGGSQDGKGHYQIAPVGASGGNSEHDDGEVYTYKYSDNSTWSYQYSINKDAYAPNWFYEYFIPWSSMLDKNGDRGYAYDGFGFEVVIDDNDTGLKDDRNRIVWANEENGEDDSWDNMDEAGTLYFNDFEVIYADEIILTADDITEDGQTSTINVEMISEEPGIPVTDPTLTWYIVPEGTTAKYKWDEDSLKLKALSDGTFTIYAEDATGWVTSNELTITISNQILTLDEANFIVDGYNENPQEDGKPNDAWLTGSGNGINGHTAYIEDGIFYFSSDSMLDVIYNMKIVQEVDIAYEDKDLEYVARWKMWAGEETSFPLVSEDNRQSWANWAVPDSTNHTDNVEVEDDFWNINVTTEPQWYEVHFTGANMVEETDRTYFGFKLGFTGGVTIAMDSMYLIAADAADIICWDCIVGVDQNRLTQETLNVYPNPATDVLNVTLSAPNSRVAIYNSVGVKVEETVVEGSVHTFDVSGYSPGLYFVRTNNAVAKFVK